MGGPSRHVLSTSNVSKKAFVLKIKTTDKAVCWKKQTLWRNKASKWANFELVRTSFRAPISEPNFTFPCPFSIHFLNIYPFLFHSLFLPLFLSYTSLYLQFLIPAFTLHSQFTTTTLYSIHRLLTNHTHITNTTPVQWFGSNSVKLPNSVKRPLSTSLSHSFFHSIQHMSLHAR